MHACWLPVVLVVAAGLYGVATLGPLVRAEYADETMVAASCRAGSGTDAGVLIHLRTRWGAVPVGTCRCSGRCDTNMLPHPCYFRKSDVCGSLTTDPSYRELRFLGLGVSSIMTVWGGLWFFMLVHAWRRGRPLHLLEEVLLRE
jgi:hypothetical protein